MKYSVIGAAASLIAAGSVTAYDLARTYAGDTFFDAWNFHGSFDNTTSGDVIYVDRQTGSSEQLSYINSAGNAIVKVDNTTFVPYNEKRNSVQLISREKFKLGTVWVFDALHIPSGCSVWGAFWSRGAYSNWPEGGEIDIFEGINLQEFNQMALHTMPGCAQAPGVTQTGQTGVTDCDYQANGGSGCTVRDTNPASYGPAFAAAGGGVWVTEFATTGVNIWFYPRADVPAALSGETLDTASLGTPTASYPSSSCNPAEFFSEQEIIINITLCGTWAGIPSILQETCGALVGDLTCYTTYVIDNKSTYENAYFEISSVKIFAESEDAIVAAPPLETTTGTGTSRPTSTDGSTGFMVESPVSASGVVALAFSAMFAMAGGYFAFA